MRHLFDQYSHPENRLTHALVNCLNEDKKLLRHFIKWAIGEQPPPNIVVLEQSLPGEYEYSEEESEKKGLPDAWIHNNDSWSLLIESKISASLSTNQLQRHYHTAISRGFDDVKLLAIDLYVPKQKLPYEAFFKSWPEIYRWMTEKSNKSYWATKLKGYMEVAETKLSLDGYFKEGTLTVFSGFPFSIDNPYNYPEAKRVLKLAIDELRKRKDLVREVGVDPQLIGRGAITGKQGTAVWDFLRLKESREEQSFTKFPHLTLSVRRDDIFALVTVPNNIKTEFRKNLLSHGETHFVKIFEEIRNNLEDCLKNAKGAVPWVEVLQRHYPSQRSQPVVDALLAFDLRTAFNKEKSKVKSGVKYQPGWLHASYEALSKKQANVQLAVGVIFPYTSCREVNNSNILDVIAKVWIACKPLINTMIRR